MVVTARVREVEVRDPQSPPTPETVNPGCVSATMPGWRIYGQRRATKNSKRNMRKVGIDQRWPK
jgi:hypothetical protein